MTRLEIVANNTVEEDILEGLESVEPGFSYSKINSIHGRGHSDPRRGDAVWPEENFIFIIYCDDEKAKAFVTAVKQVKERFEGEGIKIYALPFHELD